MDRYKKARAEGLDENTAAVKVCIAIFMTEPPLISSFARLIMTLLES